MRLKRAWGAALICHSICFMCLDPFYLENYLSPSEPRILYFSHPARPARRMHDSSYGRDAARLLSIVDKIRANNTPSAGSVHTQPNPHLKLPVARLRDGEVAELCEDPEKNLESFIALHYIRLPWNAVRLHLEERGRNRGYFICFGWNPVSDELYYSGPILS